MKTGRELYVSDSGSIFKAVYRDCNNELFRTVDTVQNVDTLEEMVIVVGVNHPTKRLVLPLRMFISIEDSTPTYFVTDIHIGLLEVASIR